MNLPSWVLGELVADLSEFLGREQVELLDYIDGEYYISDCFDEYFGGAFITEGNRERLSAWLRHSQYHLFDLTRWHIRLTEYFTGLYSNIEYRPAWTLLDFGSGIGTHSILYTLKGWNATLCDVNIPCLSFSKARFEKRHLGASFVNEVEAVNYFDRVLLLDTVGHLEEPEATFEPIIRSMKVGATIEITWDLFDEPVRSHIWSKKNRAAFEDILIEKGLIKTDKEGSQWIKRK